MCRTGKLRHAGPGRKTLALVSQPAEEQGQVNKRRKKAEQKKIQDGKKVLDREVIGGGEVSMNREGWSGVPMLNVYD